MKTCAAETSYCSQLDVRNFQTAELLLGDPEEVQYSSPMLVRICVVGHCIGDSLVLLQDLRSARCHQLLHCLSEGQHRLTCVTADETVWVIRFDMCVRKMGLL